MRVNIAVADLGTLYTEYADDWTTGVTTYAVRGPRIAGAFTLTLSPGTDDELDPDGPYVRVGYGRGARVLNDCDRPDRPTINGVRLVGASVVNTDRMRQRRLTRHDIAARRSLDRYSCTSAPERTQTRAAGVITGLLTHWLTRPDNLALRLAAVRDHADRTRGDLAEAIARQRERVADEAAALQRLQHRAELVDQAAAMPPAARPATHATTRLTTYHPRTRGRVSWDGRGLAAHPQGWD